MRATGLSQRQFAARAAITQGTISRLLTLPSLEEVRPSTLQGLAEALGVPVEVFIAEAQAADTLDGTPSWSDVDLMEAHRTVAWLKSMPAASRVQMLRRLATLSEVELAVEKGEEVPASAVGALGQAVQRGKDPQESPRKHGGKSSGRKKAG